MKKSRIIALLMSVAIGVTVFGGCTETKDANKNGIENNQSVESGDNENIEDIKDSLPDVDVPEENVDLKEEKSFKFTVEEGSADLSFGTPWKNNESNTKYIAIEGRGPEALEEGIGFVYLKTGDTVKSLVISDGGDNLAPKYVEWYDDDTFMVYMVNRYGRVFTGGTLYMVDVDEMKPVIVYQAKEDEEISEATKISADIINIKMLKHNSEAEVSVEKNIKIK